MNIPDKEFQQYPSRHLTLGNAIYTYIEGDEKNRIKDSLTDGSYPDFLPLRGDLNEKVDEEVLKTTLRQIIGFQPSCIGDPMREYFKIHIFADPQQRAPILDKLCGLREIPAYIAKYDLSINTNTDREKERTMPFFVFYVFGADETIEILKKLKERLSPLNFEPDTKKVRYNYFPYSDCPCIGLMGGNTKDRDELFKALEIHGYKDTWGILSAIFCEDGSHYWMQREAWEKIVSSL